MVLSITLLPMTGHTAENDRQVRVGVFPLGNFHNMDEDGVPYGYDVDYITQLQRYTHWNIEFVQTENWKDALAKLDAGEIDLVAPAQKTPEREEFYQFSAYAMSTEMGAVQTLVEREEPTYEDFSAMAKLHYGAMEGSPLTTAFLTYAEEAGFTPNITYYNDATVMYQALYDHEVDAVATNIMLGDDRVQLIGRYAPEPVFYMSRKADTEMMDELNNAMTELTLNHPEYQNELFAKYFPTFSNTQLTYEEREYASKMPEIAVGFVTNQAPLSYVDPATGELSGITRGILDHVEATTGLKFRYEALPEGEVTYDYLNENHIYVLANVEYNDINNDISALHLTSPYLESERVLVAKDGLDFTSDSEMSVALTTGSETIKEVIAQTYPNFELKTYDDLNESFQAVVSGQVDAAMQNRYVAECLLTNPAYADLTILPIKSLNDDLCIGTMKYNGDDSELSTMINSETFRSIIDKAVKQLSTDSLNDIIIQNTSKARHRVTIWDMLKQNKVAFMLGFALVCAIIFMLFWKQHLEQDKAKELAVKNDALKDAVSQAEKANRAKSQFLSRMSHEIRTPMNAIVGITNIAKTYKTDPAKVEDYLSKIDSSSHVLLNIINDVLDMSAIESDKLKIANVEFDIKQVLNNLSTVYYPQCKAKGIDFVMSTDIKNETLIGDSLRVNQILMNLVSNAYKFTDEGGQIRITVQETTRKDEHVYLRFAVSDSGCGMSEEMMSRLFKPFEQESAVTAQSHGGSGLGMSIAKNLVDMMHGAIKVESEKGKGTTFTVDLPFVLSGRNAQNQDDKLKDIRALVVDDDAEAAEYTSLVLQRIGVQYDVVSSGSEALQKATTEHQQGRCYDICFVDWRMPGMDGADLTRHLRRLFDRDTLIIIVSAYDPAEVEDDAKAAGADMFISKPLFQSTVFNLLMSLSGGKYINNTADANEFDFTGHRVLMAEDNALNREIAVELLNMVHLEVECAEDGQKAVDMFRASAPGYYEAILMDIQMPILDGYEAAEAIRTSEHLDAQSVPIYAMTANAFSEDVSASLNAGMDGHISKPIDTEVLYRTIAAAIYKK